MHIRALIAKYLEFVKRSVGIRERLKMDENVFSLLGSIKLHEYNEVNNWTVCLLFKTRCRWGNSKTQLLNGGLRE
jgi:hypothetical protein